MRLAGFVSCKNAPVYFVFDKTWFSRSSKFDKNTQNKFNLTYLFSKAFNNAFRICLSICENISRSLFFFKLRSILSKVCINSFLKDHDPEVEMPEEEGLIIQEILSEILELSKECLFVWEKGKMNEVYLKIEKQFSCVKNQVLNIVLRHMKISIFNTYLLLYSLKVTWNLSVFSWIFVLWSLSRKGTLIASLLFS